MLDSLVRVSRRAAYSHYASILADARTSVQAGRITSPLYVNPEGRYVSGTFIRPPKLMLACLQKSNPGKSPGEQLQASLAASASLLTISRAV
jgi:hypothetical protein